MKKLLAAVITLSMVLSFAAIPAHAATFSSANKSSVAYNLNAASSGSDWTNTSDTTEVAVNDAVTGSGTRESWGKVAISRTISSAAKDAIRYYRNNDAYWNVDAPKYIHQRVKFVWRTAETSNPHNISFSLRTDTSGSRAFIAKIIGRYRDDIYFEHYNKSTPTPQNENSRYTYNSGVPFTITPSSGGEVENTLDIIINLNDKESKHKGMVYLFFNGKLYVYAKAPTVPSYFYGWTFTINDARSGDELKLTQVAPYGHTEYRDANGYVVTFEDVLNDAGLMTDDISGDSTKMMQVSGANFENFMPDGDTKAVLDASDVNANTDSNWLNCEDRPGGKKLDWSGTEATVVHTTGDSSAWDDKVVSFLGGVYPQTAHGIAYSSYHPRAKFIKLSFDQTITSGTLRYNITRGSALNEIVRFQENEGKLAVVIPNNERGRTTTYNYNDEDVPIDIILEPIEEDGNPVQVNVYVKINGELVNYGYVDNTAAVRMNDITLSTKGDATVTWDNIVYTLYNENASLSTFGIDLTPAPSVEEIDTETVLDEAVDKDGETVVLTENGILDIGEDLYFRNGYVDATNGYIRTGDRKITGSKVRFTSEGKISVDDGYSAKISRDNEDETKDQGFIFGLYNPTGIRTVILDVTGGENDGKTVEKEFDFDGWEIYGLVNFGFEINAIPTAVDFNVKSF